MNTVIAGLTIPFLGTLLGAAMVFFLRKDISQNVQKMLLGFASGVMIAASFWSLLVPSLEMAAEQGQNPWLPTAIGFLCGMGFLLVLDSLTPHLHLDSDTPEGVNKRSLKKTTLLILAVTLHNIPEGMAVGVVLANSLMEGTDLSFLSALVLPIGIAIQNFPEGAIVSMPLRGAGDSKIKSFMHGALSGIVEPVAGIITILLTSFMLPILPFILAFAAGAMIYVVVEELIPESQQEPHSNVATIGVGLGFALMMVLDVALG